MEHFLQGEEQREIVKVSPPWSWNLFWILAAAVAVSLVLAFVGHLEVHTRGRGILRPVGGIRLLTAQVGGVVTQVPAGSGRTVHAGDPILQLESATLQAQFLEADRQAQAVRADYRSISSRQDELYAQQASMTKARLQLLQEEVRSQEESIRVYERKVKANEELEKAGLMSPLEVDNAREALSEAKRRLISSRQGLSAARNDLAGLESRRQSDLWQRSSEVRSAEVKKEGLSFAMGQTLIQAPVDGVLESVVVHPGDVIQPGQVVGKLVPKGSPFQVISFLPEKDRAYLLAGSTAGLELDQYPYAEHGTLKAKILRIGDDLATPQELQEALGDAAKDQGPVYRVELQLLDEGGRPKDISLRSGMLMQVRYTLRRQRPIEIVLEPLRRWLR